MEGMEHCLTLAQRALPSSLPPSLLHQNLRGQTVGADSQTVLSEGLFSAGNYRGGGSLG